MSRSTFALAAMAGMLATVSASAADLPRRATPPVYPAVYDAAYNWTGFYVGINGGSGSGTYLQDPAQTGPFGGELAAISPKGWFYGVQAGYNKQYGKLVVGLETDFQFSRIGGSRTIDWCPGCFGSSASETQKVEMPWFGTTRARLGFTPWERVLVYATGGIAYGKVTMTDEYNYNYSYYPGYSYAYNYKTVSSGFGVGPVYGVGIEWAFADNWTAKAEYLHTDLGLNKTSLTCTYCTPYVASTRLQENLMRGGINYKF